MGCLPPTEKDKKFRYVDDRSRVRMFLFATIRIESRILYILDIERSGKSLFPLILYRKDYKGISGIKTIMEKLIDNNGTWDMKGILINGFVERRLRRFKGRSFGEIGRKYYEKIINL